MYSDIPAVKQINGMSCWAAGMKWWQKGVRSVYKSQKGYIKQYASLMTGVGGMGISGMRSFIQREGLRVDEPSSMQFTIAKLKEHLEYSPLFVAFVCDAQTLHVNVIYELENEISGTNERYSQVRVMEPQSFTGPGVWEGKHETKCLGDFTWFGTCMIGSLRP